jgi:hypothetical protein
MAALSFASDLGTGNLMMTILGTSIALQGSERLKSLLDKPDETSAVVEAFGPTLRSMESLLPSMKAALDSERLSMEDGVILEARQEVAERGLLNTVFPCRLVAARHLSSNLRVVSRYAEAIELPDARQRESADVEIRHSMASAHSGVLRAGLPDWVRMRDSEEKLRRTYRLLLAVIDARARH